MQDHVSAALVPLFVGYRTSGNLYPEIGLLAEVVVEKARVFLNAENLLSIKQNIFHSMPRPQRAPDGQRTVDATAPLKGNAEWRRQVSVLTVVMPRGQIWRVVCRPACILIMPAARISPNSVRRSSVVIVLGSRPPVAHRRRGCGLG